MKKLYLFALAAMMFAACATDDTQDLRPIDAPETLTVGFEGGDDDTRVQLNSAGKTVWTEGDFVSVFYRSNANQKWQFQGDTGERTGLLKRVSTPEATITLSDVVVAYPYSEEYYINPKTCNIQAYLPATQSYLKDSFGLDGNLMVSASEYNQIYLKNVCGWLKLQLTGNGEMVQSITLKGNNGEQVAGSIYVDTETATATLAAETNGGYEDGVGGTLVFDDAILTEVVLNCGDGVTLSTEATAFYIALPPQTFEKGLTVEIEDAEGLKMKKSTFNTLSIERNCIQPMTEFEYSPNIPHNNQIWYTNGSTTEATTPYDTSVFGANIVSNLYDAEKECWVITFDGDVTKIGEEAFFGNNTDCKNITSIAIPDSVTSIGDYAFYYCPSLTNITIPDSVTEIGIYAFCKCTSLTSITIPNSVTEIKEGAFSNCTSLTSVTIPDSVTEIGNSAFSNCSSLTSVNIPNSVTSIGNGAFYGCTSLTSATIPDSVTEIGNFAFSNCDSLTSVTIPDSVTSIGERAFTYCTSLTSVTIGNGVTSIGEMAFTYCISLKEVYCKPTTPPTGGSGMFGSNASGRRIFVPESDDDRIKNAYKAAQYWSNYKSYIFEYDFSTEQ